MNELRKLVVVEKFILIQTSWNQIRAQVFNFKNLHHYIFLRQLFSAQMKVLPDIIKLNSSMKTYIDNSDRWKRILGDKRPA